MSDPAPRLPDRAVSSGVRASDRDREAVVDRLRAATSEGRLTLDEFGERVAVVLEARTYDELVPVTADLPVMVEPETDVAAGRTTEAGGAPRRRLVNVFGSSRHAGSWQAAPEMTVVAVFGHCHVDLAACRLPPGVTSVDVRTFGVFAGVEVVVPAGAVVDAGGFSVFGGRHLRHDQSADAAGRGLRVRVRSYGIFGGVLVRSSRRVP